MQSDRKNSMPRLLSTGGIGKIPSTWSVLDTGDFNGDGMSDLLWRDTSGNTSIWSWRRPERLATSRRPGPCNRSMRSEAVITTMTAMGVRRDKAS
jgi:hypothetical protein